MNLIQCVNAYIAIQSMMGKEMDFQTAYALVKLKRELYPQVLFYQQEERRLMEEYAAKDEKGQVIWTEAGRFVFQDPERAPEYNAKRQELGAVKAYESFTPLSASRPESIKPAQVEALEGFLQFGSEEST